MIGSKLGYFSSATPGVPNGDNPSIPDPTLTTISPTSATKGDDAFTLTVNGTNFFSDSVVYWNGVARTTTYVSSTQLTAAILAADVANAGTASVTVGNSSGGRSNAATFTINAEFIFTVTTVTSPDTFPLPLVSDGTYNCTVSWGDTTSSTITVWNQAEATHTYATAGTYTITITGTIIGWNWFERVDIFTKRQYMTEIQKWENLQFVDSDENGYFYGCSNLTITATDIIDLTGITNLKSLFFGCSSLVTIPSINSWDISSITDMSSMFNGCSLFNQALSWDVSNVTDMSSMFQGASAFNQDIGGWDVSAVTNMNSMFAGSAFDQNIGGWDVSAVTTMEGMFSGSNNLNLFNYDALLIGWGAQSVQPGVTFDAGGSMYLEEAEAARAHLVLAVGSGGHGWTITDGGISD